LAEWPAAAATTTPMAKAASQPGQQAAQLRVPLHLALTPPRPWPKASHHGQDPGIQRCLG